MLDEPTSNQGDLPANDGAGGNGAGRVHQLSPAERAAELEMVRKLLLGSEWDRVVDLRERFDDPTLHAQEISRVLPAAIAIRSSQDDDLGAALAPTLEDSLRSSVRKHPQAIVDAIFPVMGPAIRRAVADTFLRAIQGLNEAIESSFSWQGLKWRLEALRTGKPYAEVVLLHKLVYRVEQVFLIHRETGLMLQHLQADSVAAQDADMVSGMLTAIQDFVKDSFKVEGGDSLNNMRVGNLNVWIAHSPHLVLAAVVRGIARQDFLTLLTQALEAVCERMGPAMTDFSGDASVFAACRADLEPLLVEARRDPPRKQRRTVLGWLAVGLLLGAIVLWGVLTWMENSRWESFVTAVQNEPGIIVTSTEKDGGLFSRGRFFIRGLRDPFANDPASHLADAHLDPERVSMHWEAIETITPAFVEKRAVAILRPPQPDVKLTFADGTLYARGRSLHRWIVDARARAGMVTGARYYDDSQVEDITVTELGKIKARIDKNKPRFIVNTTDLAAGQEKLFQDLVRDIQALVKLAESESVPLRIELIGHTDSSGAEAKNMRLSKDRADKVASVLVAAGVNADWLTPLGVGATDPMVDEKSEDDRTTNRRVGVRVVIDARRQ